jgi:AraC-like DNA-binding protein
MQRKQAFDLTKQELNRKLYDAGYKRALIHLSPGRDSAIAKGNISFDALTGGLHIHSTDTTEVRGGQSSSEVNNCVSLNFLLRGRIDYALNETRYSICAEKEPVLFINVFGKKCLFTRYFNPQQVVRKIGITFEKDWFLKRCHNLHETAAIEQLFSKPQPVVQQTLSSTLLGMVNELFTINMQTSLINKLAAEQLAVQILTHCYSLIFAPSKKDKQLVGAKINIGKKLGRDYEKAVENLLFDNLSLEEIARKLGTSVSSLQRYFKAHHQLTVIEYIRNERLEKARHAMLHDGISIGEAAYYAGYNHVSNFVTAFKKYFEITPAEFLKSFQR